MSVTSTIPDLWPTDFKIGSDPSPATILRQQGYLLGERTRDVVYGEVVSGLESGTRFVHDLFLSAPYCKVRQRVLMVYHGLDGYPVTLVLLNSTGNEKRSTAANATEFIEALREMLASPQIVELVGSLISQARELDDE
jgi:hypothetical protein